MRTTVELDDELRAKLLSLAAKRGEKGFSRFVNEAVSLHLADLEGAREARRKALRLRGALSPEEAATLRKATIEVRRGGRAPR